MQHVVLVAVIPRTAAEGSHVLCVVLPVMGQELPFLISCFPSVAAEHVVARKDSGEECQGHSGDGGHDK